MIFQAHPVLHAGQKAKADQSDWENREFTMANLNLNSANFYLSGNAKLNTNIIAENSKIFLGSDKILLDKNDGTGKETTAIEDTLANSYRSSFTGGISATMSDVEISSSDVNLNRSSYIVGGELNIKDKANVEANSGLFVMGVDENTYEMTSGNINIENSTLTLSGSKGDNGYYGEYYAGNIKLNGAAELNIYNQARLNGDISGNGAAKIDLIAGEITGAIDAKNTTLNLNPDSDGMWSTWNITGDSRLKSLSANFAAINFSNIYAGSNYATLNVDTLDLQGSSIFMRTNLIQGDKIIVSKKFTGANNSLYIDLRADSAVGDEVELILAPAGTDKNIFTTVKQTSGISNVTPKLEVVDNDSKTSFMLAGYEASINEAALNTAKSFNDSASSVLYPELNNLNKRMGDLRDSSGDAGVWARYMIGQGKGKDGYKNTYNHVQIGADKRTEISGGALFTGLTLSYTHNKAELDSSFDGKTKTLGVGAYASAIFDSGFYADFIAKYLFQNNNYDYYNPYDSGKYNSHSIYADVEVGYRAKFDGGLFIEPQAELTYGRIGGRKINIADQILIDSKSYNALVGRVGFDFGKTFEGNDWRTTAKIGASYQFDITNNGQTIISDSYSETLLNGERDSRALINAGLAFEIGKNTRIGIDYERSFGGKYNIQNELNLRARYSF